MIKITNNGSGEINLPIVGGCTIGPDGGSVVVEQTEWENLLAINMVARNLSIRGVLSVEVAKFEDAPEAEVEAEPVKVAKAK